MNKLNKKEYFFYFLLFRNIQLLFNGYSNKLTGFWLLVNCIICTVVFFLLKKQKINEYLMIFILGFTFFLIDYSSFRDWNKKFNTFVLIILMVSIFFQVLIIIKNFLKNKEKIFLIILSFILSKIFLFFLTDFYLEPRKVVYSTYVSSIKDNGELEKIIKKMPMVNDVYIDKKNSNGDFSNYYKEENLDEIIEISLKYSINHESMDLFANKVKDFIKLQGKEKKFIKIYFINDNNYEEALKVYNLKNNELKVADSIKNLQSDSGIFTNIILYFVKILKGEDYFF